MKIIVCGAGPVGRGIARQLVSEDNSVTVIDSIPEHIQATNDSLDVSAFLGSPAHPTVLEEAGASDAEMIIAVTTSDEVNMVICQVAHSLFNVPIKIARIRHQNYLQPIWKDLYRHDHLPIDYIISPEQEVANAIMNRLHVPGAMDSIPFADDKFKVIEVKCQEGCSILDQSLSKVYGRYPELKMSVIGVMREDGLHIPDGKEKLHAGDDVFFVADSEHVPSVMSLFGHEEKEARRVLIIGGGNIGLYIAQAMAKEESDINAKMIEINKERAEYVASKLPQMTVINGNSLEQEILFEANIDSTETLIAVTNDDEVNIISSLLAKRFGCQRVFSLVNESKSYGPLISSLGIDAVINPREMTVSSILQYTRKGKVRAAHSICSGSFEIIETEAVTHSVIVGKDIKDLDLPGGVKICAILRKKETIIPNDDTIIAENDRIVIIARTSQIKKVDQILSARLDYF